MKLMLSQVELDANVEHEFFATDENKEFGFTAVISMLNGEIEIRNNCTEIHHRFKSHTPFGPSIAFESDIHGTGGTIDIKRIASVVILEAKNKAKNY